MAQAGGADGGGGAAAAEVDAVFPLDRVRDAHHRAESREAFGRIVVTI